MNPYFKINKIKLYNDDCMNVMKNIDNDTIQLIVTSPPYYNLKNYQDGFNKWGTYEQYLQDNKKWFKEFMRILRDGGYIAWNIQENLPNPINGERLDYPLMADIIKIAYDIGFIWERNIIWNKNTSTQNYFGSYPKAGTPIFWQLTEPIIIFRKRGKYQGDSLEREKYKLESKRWSEIVRNIWTIAPASSKQRKHDAPFPHEIPRRLIQILTVPSDIVFDPFVGSGTTLEVCQELNRYCIASEISEKYCKIIKKRIEYEQISLF